MAKKQEDLIEKPKRGRKKKEVSGEIVSPEVSKSTTENAVTQNYTQEQIDFIEADPKLSIILKACAGSGKTKSTVERVKYLISKGVAPNKICVFSYTTAAVGEFKKRLNNDEVKVTTIHAFCLSMLSRMRKFKKVVDVYQFIDWYKEKYKPRFNDSEEVKSDFYDLINEMYDDAQFIGSSITAYKLQVIEKIKCPIPKFFNEYRAFLKETKSRDFSDLLIEVHQLLKDNRWLNLFKGQYDYIICDEFQDTSLLQCKILTSLNAKYYIFIGDISQSIYLYSGANAQAVIDHLKSRRDCVEMSLSVNFRSTKAIIEHSNQYSHLKAIGYKSEEGVVHKNIILFEDLLEVLKQKDEVVILVRTNRVIREIEKRLLLRKIPFKYTNYLTKAECEALKKAEARPSTIKKAKDLLPVFYTVDNAIQFIEQNANQKHFITSGHKSKGLEFSVVVSVNMVSPEILAHNKLVLSEKKIKEISFINTESDDDVENFEARNLFYVVSSRPINELYFMIFGV